MSLTGIAYYKEYKALLGIALDSAMLRKVEANQADNISKTADSGKFKDECTWPKWEIKSENYLFTIPGVNGVPLSYIVRYQSYADRTPDLQGDFIAVKTACTPLIGTQFQSDTIQLHQLLKNYLVVETAEH